MLPLALEDPKVPHRPDLDGFTRRSSSIISSLVISFILSFPSPTPSAHPRTCHQSLHLIITPAPSLQYPSPLYTQPVNASSCHLFPLALQTPHQNSITSIAMSFVVLAHTHTISSAPAPALTFPSVHSLLRNSSSGELTSIASLSSPWQIWSLALRNRPAPFPFPVVVLCFHSTLRRCRAGDECVPASSPALTGCHCAGWDWC